MVFIGLESDVIVPGIFLVSCQTHSKQQEISSSKINMEEFYSSAHEMQKNKTDIVATN